MNFRTVSTNELAVLERGTIVIMDDLRLELWGRYQAAGGAKKVRLWEDAKNTDHYIEVAEQDLNEPMWQVEVPEQDS